MENISLLISLLYEFSIALPFGLATAPRVFTNLVKPTYHRLFTRIIHTYYYFLRHIAVFGNFVADCSQNVSAVIKVLEEIYGVVIIDFQNRLRPILVIY